MHCIYLDNKDGPDVARLRQCRENIEIIQYCIILTFTIHNFTNAQVAAK